MARKVYAKCGRVPRIVAAVGKALRKKKDRSSWEDALNQLVNCKPEKIARVTKEAYACLQLSFKVLDEDAYLLLLLCSLYGEDEAIWIEDLFRLATVSGLLKGWDTLEAARSRVDAMVYELKSSSLLLENEKHIEDEELLVKLHDIIRDVARFKHGKETEYAFFSASCDSLWPKADDLSRQKLIKLDFKSKKVNFPDDFKWLELQTLYLNCSKMSGKQLPASFFESFPKLICLFLNVKSLYALPSFLQKCKRLNSLTIISERVKDMSFLVEFKNLEMLAINISDFGGALPDLRGLRGLRMLDLRGDIEITEDVLSGLLNLEELYLPTRSYRRRMRLSSSSALSELTHLNKLEIDLDDFKSCPDENICKKLGRYKISLGGGYATTALRSVKLQDCSIKGGAKTLVERAEYVILCTNVKGIQNCFSQGGVGGGAFTDLKSLAIHGCAKEEEEEYVLGGMMRSPITHIHQPQHAPSFSNLTKIENSDSGFKYAFSFSAATCLPQLEELRIAGCEKMEEIVGHEGHQTSKFLYFPKLRQLHLKMLPALKSFCGKGRDTLFDCTVVFPALKEIQLFFLDNVSEIWEDQGHPEDSFCQIEFLNVMGCHQLKNVIPYQMGQRFQYLKELQMLDCDSFVCVSTNTSIVLPRLQHMYLRGLPELNSTHINLFPNLEELTIANCNKLRNVFLPLVPGNLKFSRKICIEDCKMMKEIIASVGKETATKERHRVQLVADTCEEVLFPQLLQVMLHKLPELKHFSSNPHYLKMPLVQFEVLKCSQFLCFTPRQIMSSPKVHIEITYQIPDEQQTAVCMDSLENINNYLLQPLNTQGMTWFDEYKKLHPEAESKSELEDVSEHQSEDDSEDDSDNEPDDDLNDE